jgi:hypothetical protein
MKNDWTKITECLCWMTECYHWMNVFTSNEWVFRRMAYGLRWMTECLCWIAEFLCWMIVFTSNGGHKNDYKNKISDTKIKNGWTKKLNGSRKIKMAEQKLNDWHKIKNGWTKIKWLTQNKK